MRPVRLHEKQFRNMEKCNEPYRKEFGMERRRVAMPARHFGRYGRPR